MSATAADVQAMVDRVNAIAEQAGSPGSFWQEYGGWLFATQGAEIRDFLRIVDDRLVVSNAQRAETKEQLVFSTPLLEDMEKFLTFYFCSSLRWDRQLPMLLVVSIPVTNDKVAPGFAITELDEYPWYELHHTKDSVVRYGDDVQLVKFSHYVGLSPEEIRESALDPEGKPHFMVMAQVPHPGCAVVGSPRSSRSAGRPFARRGGDASVLPHYVLTVLDGSHLAGHGINQYLAEDLSVLGVTVIWGSEDRKLLPETVTALVEYANQTAGTLVNDEGMYVDRGAG